MKKADSDEREIIPLVMLPGNMEILLGHRLNVKSISLEWSEDHANAVVLMIHGADQEQVKELGFQTRRVISGKP